MLYFRAQVNQSANEIELKLNENKVENFCWLDLKQIKSILANEN